MKLGDLNKIREGAGGKPMEAGDRASKVKGLEMPAKEEASQGQPSAPAPTLDAGQPSKNKFMNMTKADFDKVDASKLSGSELADYLEAVDYHEQGVDMTKPTGTSIPETGAATPDVGTAKFM